ncbi:N(4)-(beta-N-acetylglucosaminyl)-L-asparaginase [Lacticaseibacillus sharpeae]|uniref:Asparaginase n=1 Tax=Lacticaseibacillus sharpeae JCM 1186 = DSM 20505 TaxID=1291052 RepID=A0A0R1ZXB9_9LACO|nr:N(4)-(beta-N-acetylglucosaminyl)-L-asparaginase [Lacticaseibacillus sharpeae]KRM56505.1 asparaginase [Lacticaseibacillus sharpeae JCM 1186 = DSM 20505]
MTNAIIGTWRMAGEGVQLVAPALAAGGSAADAVERGIMAVENNPANISVGYGALPNRDGVLEMDSAFMNGANFQIGAIAGARDIANPIRVSRRLSEERVNNVLVGRGAESFADACGFERKDMVTAKARAQYLARKAEVAAGARLTPYDGHDTVGMIALDNAGQMVAGTSTSGLFMKHAGRVGDSPLAGNGFYVDREVGGAVATGLGEDMMKRPLCFEIVDLMARGMAVQAAMNQAVYGFIDRLQARNGNVGEFSYVALDKDGNFGVASNVEFQFAVAVNGKAHLYVVTPLAGHELQINQEY